MIITDKERLKDFSISTRKWQGIPSVAATKKGRLFVCFYSGHDTEDLGNYCALTFSDDQNTFIDPIAVVYFGEDSRAYDPVVWVDPLNRLWFICCITPKQKVLAYVCDNPDADTLVFNQPIELSDDMISHKPTVMDNGEWWFPIFNCGKGLFESSVLLCDTYSGLYREEKENKAYSIVSKDQGKTFEKRGGVAADSRSFDEHQFLETNNGVDCFIRTHYGIGKSTSVDSGYTWTKAVDSGFFGPDSKFLFLRLNSGNVLIVGHQKGANPDLPLERANLTAFLSIDGGVTFPYKLLLDERTNVSYPEGQQTGEYIYVTYDRERRTDGEILLAKFTEEDIINGKLTSNGYLKKTVTKLVK